MFDLYSYFGDSHKPSEINWHVQYDTLKQNGLIIIIVLLEVGDRV